MELLNGITIGSLIAILEMAVLMVYAIRGKQLIQSDQRDR